MWTRLCLFFCLLAIQVFAKEEICEIPQTFQSNLMQVFMKNKCATFVSYGNLFYNYPEKHVRVDLCGKFFDSNDGDRNITMSVFFDFKEKKQYIVDRDSNKCMKKTLEKELTLYQIPEKSKRIGMHLIGTQPIQSYHFAAKDMKQPTHHIEDVDIMMQVTHSTCFLESLVGFNTTAHEVFLTQRFFNFIPSTPAYFFDLPAVCHDAKLIPEKDDDVPSIVYEIF